jgi:hypothetical protein
MLELGLKPAWLLGIAAVDISLTEHLNSLPRQMFLTSHPHREPAPRPRAATEPSRHRDDPVAGRSGRLTLPICTPPACEPASGTGPAIGA